MKKKYFVPSAREISVDYSCFLALSNPPASGVQGFMQENQLDLAPTVIGGDYNRSDDDDEFIEGD